MNIYGIAYEVASSNCYEYHFLDQLKNNRFPEMKIQNKIPTTEIGDVLIINIDVDNAARLFGKGQIPPQNAYTVMVVHELDRSVLPILKMADLLIFSTEAQRILCEEFIGMKLNCMVMPLPTGDFPRVKEERTDWADFLIYLDYNFDESEIDKIVEQAENAYKLCHIITSGIFHVCIHGPNHSNKAWHKLEVKLREIAPGFLLHNIHRLERSEFIEILKNCSRAFVDNRSLPEDYFLKMVDERQSWILHLQYLDMPILSDLKWAGIPLNGIPCLAAWNYNHNLLSTYEEYADFLGLHFKNEVDSGIKTRIDAFNSVEVDKLDDLNIIKGEPLNNIYIFSVCFRNQKNRIARCIESLVCQNKERDFGIVIIDDQSDDGSLEIVLETLDKYPDVDSCVVYNKINRKAARNFYNVGHLLTTNPESVICEVDGDDFLANDKVLDTLEKYYRNGALKTNGSYDFHGQEVEHMSPEDLERQHQNLDYSRPWSVDYCNAWLSLRTCKRHLLTQVELCYFMDRHKVDWLHDRHDSAIQPRIIELSEGKSVYVPEVLYKYDLTGDNHDHENGQKNEEYIKMFFHLDKVWHPLPLCASH